MTNQPTPPPTPAINKHSGATNPRGLRIAIAAGIVLLGVGLWLVTLVPGWVSRNPGQDPAVATPASGARRIQATLFYVTDDGTALTAVTREVVFGESAIEQARQIVVEQVKTPEGMTSAIPAGVTVRGVFRGAKGEMYVDLSPEVASGHKGGSLDEALAVYAIVNAITTNLPDVTGVQILIDGKEVDSLAGHIDLREPLAKSETWIRKGQQ